MIGTHTGLWQRWRGFAALLMLVGLAAGSLGAKAAPMPTVAQNTLVGSVLVEGGGPATGAVVGALHDETHTRTVVDGSGAYSMTLETGDWQVIVAAPPPSS